MAVHVPLSFDAQLEALCLMLSSNNIVSPQNGLPIAVPSQDMVLGVYYLTKQREADLGEGKVFSSYSEVRIAYDNGRVGLHAKIKVRDPQRRMIETTVGRAIFNQIVPEELGYINELLTKKRIAQIIALIFRRCGHITTVKFLDKLKNLGFTYATKGGLSVNIEDIVIPAEKVDIVDRAQAEVDKVEEHYRNGFITHGERYNKIIDVWTKATSRVADRLFTALQNSQAGFNSLFMMVDSGARGSKEQVRQLSGMRGLMAKPQKSLTGQTGELIENPVISNFREGLTILEYFISTHGARKGLADTALKTADAGYLTRRLVDVAQDVVIGEYDCGTIRGVQMSALKEGEDVKEPLYERILGRVTLHDVFDPLTGDKIVAASTLIDEDVAQRIAETSLESVDIRSVLTCESRRGICAKCYGRNLTSSKLVNSGEAVGVIAAQSIGEPGTQLTLRTFHTGGTALLIASQSQVAAKFEGKVEFDGVKKIMRNDDREVVVGRSGVIHILDRDNRVISKYDIPYGSVLMVHEGQEVPKGELLYERDPYNAMIITEHGGVIRYKDLIEDTTYREEPDEQTGHITKTVIDSRDRTKTPTIEVVDSEGRVWPYIVPTHAHLVVDDGEDIGAGEILVKIPREIGKTRDITGGLPRVTELFEARSHGDKPKRGSRVLVVTSHDGNTRRDYTVPIGKHVLVQAGDTVHSGERMTDGIVNARDILAVRGVAQVQEYLVNEIQDVYRMQGVKINDKHIEVIVRQMLQKVRVVDPGDTGLLEDDQTDRLKFLAENEAVEQRVVVTARHDSKFKVGQLVNKRKFKETNADLRKKEKVPAESRPAEPATSEPILLGITQASLTTESFISAASFQETTKVLTDAAVEGKVDYLHGLKENVIVGHLIPAGTGLQKYSELIVTSHNDLLFSDRKVEPPIRIELTPAPEEPVIEEQFVEEGEPE
jgi:DNA-directed RNA polymerase subunit beta'